MMTITVPATSANLGLGFDCLGLALDLNLTVRIIGPSDEWTIKHPYGADVPSDKRNLIIKTALDLHPDLPAHQLEVTSDIPLARGLGSSSSAIVAGLLVGHLIKGDEIDQAQLLEEANQIEGHPDNVAPAIYGGLQLAQILDGQVSSQTVPLPDLEALTFIPDYHLETKKARAVLPKQIPYQDAVSQGQHLAALINAGWNRDLAAFQVLLEKDKLHEPYRAELVPELREIRQLFHANDIKGTYLSGAGPTIITMVAAGKGQKAEELLAKAKLKGQIRLLQINQHGFTITKD
ncbi:homoserine kinase [Eupransor demetentiae]|uniref:Homoserine kinase n=1 Tax=Eupransor demetentiae TaxID=3109584 RepID=A0ABP0ERR0_9LACO|nr:Homoserine kinase (ThrB) [Lactobacillaceae bacterium LMG 33000]